MGKTYLVSAAVSGRSKTSGKRKKRTATWLALSLALILTGPAVGTVQAACGDPNAQTVTCTADTINSGAIGGGNSGDGDGRIINVGDGLTFPPETSPCKIVDMDIVMRRERCRRSAIARNR